MRTLWIVIAVVVAGCDDVHRPGNPAGEADATVDDSTSGNDSSTDASPPDTNPPDAPDIPDVNDPLDVPDIPDGPDANDPPDVPDVDDPLDVLDIPDVPDVDDLPDVPDVDDPPDVPDVDDPPDVPDVIDPPGELTAAHCGASPAYPAGTGLVVGGGGEQGNVASTLDGETWFDASTPSLGPVDIGHTRNLIRDVAYGGGVWVAVGGYDNFYVSISCDGVNWNHDVTGTNSDLWPLGDVPEPFGTWTGGVAYKDGVFVAAGGNGQRYASEDYGLTWSPSGDWYSGNMRAVEAGNGVFVVVGHDYVGANLGVSMTSTDGINWNAPVETSGEFWNMAYGDGVFVAGGAFNPRCAWSTDGENWTECGVDGNVTGTMFVDGTFYVQTDNGYATSDDGQTWSPKVDGWLPETVAFNGDRYIYGRWQDRGFALSFGDWPGTSTGISVGNLVYGTVLYQP